MRVLIATNQLQRLSGSETVTLEFAQYFSTQGHEVTVFSNWTGSPMATLFRKSGFAIVTDPDSIRPLSFDLVYLQHQVAGLFDYGPHPDDRPRSTIAFGRLSPVGFFETGGWAHDEALGDLVLANSEETARGLRAGGTTLPVAVFHNAAPEAFHAKRQHVLPEQPRSILFVTNHSDPMLLDAIEHLRRTRKVRHLGRSGDRVSQVSPKLVQSFNLVVSIGKTVQYALASQTPVFVYDRFAGPGYLDADNFARAMDLNFSGRCTPQRRTGEQLAEEILTGYAGARQFVRQVPPDIIRKFHLSTHLEALVALPPTSNEARRERLLAHRPAINRERLLASHVRETYRRQQRLVRSLRDALETKSP